MADLGIHPDTISTDITPAGYDEIVYSLLECMAKFMALGYSLADVVRMTTSNAAKAIGLSNADRAQLGPTSFGLVTRLGVKPGGSSRDRWCASIPV